MKFTYNSLFTIFLFIVLPMATLSQEKHSVSQSITSDYLKEKQQRNDLPNTCIISQNILRNENNKVEYFTTNLPIVVIETDNDEEIVDEPKIGASMGIIFNGKGKINSITDRYNNFDGRIGIEIRGNTTKNLPKKPYYFETRIETGDNLNVSLLGLPKENDWILNASYIDKTFMRDPFAFHLSRLMGRWASHTIHCELVLNGVYQGIYILEEKIKKDKNRVDVQTLSSDDKSGAEVTGGYIFEVASRGVDFGERRRFRYPKAEDITNEQIEYLRSYDDGFRHVMTLNSYADSVIGYPSIIDEESFIDEILIQETCKNSDAYGWSSYFHKDRNGKMKAGPVWDFDQSLSNSIRNNGPNYSEWMIDYIPESFKCPTFWYKLFNDTGFRTRLSNRWVTLRKKSFHTDSLVSFIDSVASYLDDSQKRNFEKWPTLGVDILFSTEGVAERNTYQKEVDYLKTFLLNRLNWMDEQLEPTSTVGNNMLGDSPLFELGQNYPNPVLNGFTTITYYLPEDMYVTLNMYGVDGNLIKVLERCEMNKGLHTNRYNIGCLKPGMYLFEMLTDRGNRKSRKMIIGQ